LIEAEHPIFTGRCTVSLCPICAFLEISFTIVFGALSHDGPSRFANPFGEGVVSRKET